MQFKWTVPLVAAAAFVLVLALVADPAWAAPPAEAAPSEVGGNFGDWVRDNFKEIAITVAGVIAIAAVAKRDFMMGLILIALSIMALGFFIKPSPYETVGQQFLNTVFGASDQSR